MAPTLGTFLLPEGFERPRLRAVLCEGRLVGEAARHALWVAGDRRHPVRSYPDRPSGFRAPVVLVPGFMAGDFSLRLMAQALRRRGHRTYRSLIHANVGCTVAAADQLEARLEAIAQRRGSRVQVVGHSLGGLLARGLAVRRPDLVAGIVTLGSPMLAPAAHHATLTRSVDVLTRLSRAGVPGLMSADCVAGDCARESFEESRLPLPDGVAFTTVYSRRDGIVDWRACLDPLAVPVEVTATHVGMAMDPRVVEQVAAALARHSDSVLEVDRGESA
ncbi:esterase/lipase family protein [Nocardioides sp.]|uniref:esterase/lipase family protein n=1 Tax=Nocardioides sp. TaxID=35761 RepID=UPI002ED608E4